MENNITNTAFNHPNSVYGTPVGNWDYSLGMPVGVGKDYDPAKGKLRGPKRFSQCIGKTLAGLPCGAPRAKGTDMCIGHLKRYLKEEFEAKQQEFEQLEAEEVVEEDGSNS